MNFVRIIQLDYKEIRLECQLVTMSESETRYTNSMCVS